VGLWKKDLNEYRQDILLRGFGLERLIEQLQITIITIMEMNNLTVEYIGVIKPIYGMSGFTRNSSSIQQ
jgi:hypothetical protein